jgi:hypothetical protein
MSDDFPKWIGLGGWTVGERWKHGTAERLTAPGVAFASVRCQHHHRTTSAARACGQRMADYRNARDRSQAVRDLISALVGPEP